MLSAKINVDGLGKCEENATKILEHIEAIKRLQAEMNWPGLKVTLDLKDGEADSGN